MSTFIWAKGPQKYLDVEKAVLEGIEAGLEAAKPGNFAEDIEAAWRKTISKYGYEKESRCPPLRSTIPKLSAEMTTTLLKVEKLHDPRFWQHAAASA